MIEPIVEGGGAVIGLALLLYFQVWRPGREAAGKSDGAATSDPPTLPPASERDGQDTTS